MDFGRACLTYRSATRRLQRLEGRLPLADERVRLEAGRPAAAEVAVELTVSDPGLTLAGLTLEIEGVNLGDRFLANGFQSWSHTRLLGPNDVQKGLRLIGFMARYGDYEWVDYPGRPGCFRSHWLTYTVDGTGHDAAANGQADHAGAAGPADTDGRRVDFLGSLNEATAYTVFRVDYRSSRLWAEVDVEGLQPEPALPLTLAHVYHAEGSSPRDLTRGFATRLAGTTQAELASAGAGVALPAPGSLVPRLDHRPAGWNSWYNYYTDITAADMLSELEALRSAGLDLDYVQIDDGWQKTTGDWLDLSPGFAPASSSGTSAGPAAAGRVMRDLVSAIREAGYEAGIWTAPLVATKFAEATRAGWVKPWTTGWNPGWHSRLHVLDLARPEAVDYVRRVGDAFRDWGFTLVKADFLFAAGARPWGGRTRAQRGREAMILLRQAMPGRLLSCGVPLAMAAGLCDYARLGPDTGLVWDDKLLSFCRYQERPSNLVALRTIINRWFMDGTLFTLDPDVFLFGKGRLTEEERSTICEVTTTLGGLQSFSDSLRSLGPGAVKVIQGTFPLPQARVEDVTEEKRDLFSVKVAGRPGPLRVNLSTRSQGGLGPHQSRWDTP